MCVSGVCKPYKKAAVKSSLKLSPVLDIQCTVKGLLGRPNIWDMSNGWKMSPNLLIDTTSISRFNYSASCGA